MRLPLIVLSLALALFPIGTLSAQDQPASIEPQQQLLDAGELDQLVAPIALHPDPLLAQVLMASTYPLEIVQADRFAKARATMLSIQATDGKPRTSQNAGRPASAIVVHPKCQDRLAGRS